MVSDAKEETHSRNHPLCWLLLGLEVEGPHVGGASHAGLVDGTLVHVLAVLLVHGNGLNEDDWYGGGEFLQPRLLDQAGLRIPARSLHEEPVDVGPFSRRAAEVFPLLLGDVALQAHAVQRPLVLASHGLHDGRQEGLGVEEPGQPDAHGHVEVRDPVLKVSYPEEEVSVPRREAVHGGVGSLCPAVGNVVEEEGVLKVLHFGCDG